MSQQLRESRGQRVTDDAAHVIGTEQGLRDIDIGRRFQIATEDLGRICLEFLDLHSLQLPICATRGCDRVSDCRRIRVRGGSTDCRHPRLTAVALQDGFNGGVYTIDSTAGIVYLHERGS